MKEQKMIGYYRKQMKTAIGYYRKINTKWNKIDEQKIRKDKIRTEKEKNPKALCTLTPSLSQVGARSSYFCHPENAGQAGVFCP